MSQWTPDWSLAINGVDYTNLTLSNLTISSGRTDIYSQPRAGYCSVDILNLDLSPIVIDVNDGVTISVKNSAGTFVTLFGGDVTDIETQVTSTGTGGVNELIKLTALGSLSKLPKTLTEGVLSKDFDGNQIFEILSQALFNTWAEVPAAETWAGYDPTTDWLNAENAGLGEIDRPGNYELMARSASTIDIYSLASALANSGLGYLYEDNQGRIGYADSTHRSTYLAANGYVDLSANDALAAGIRIIKRLGDVRNYVSIQWRSGTETAFEAASVAQYGSQAQAIATTLHNKTDAEDQAEFYLGIRAYPENQFNSITFSLTNPEIDNTDRDALLGVFMGLPLNIVDLPSNMIDGEFQGFVEGWSWRASYNQLSLTLTLSPTAYSLQAARWNDVSVAETWNTLSLTLDWLNATTIA